MMKPHKKVKSNLDYLRKLFIMPDSPDKFIEFGHELLEMIHDFFQDIYVYRVWPSASGKPVSKRPGLFFPA